MENNTQIEIRVSTSSVDACCCTFINSVEYRSVWTKVDTKNNNEEQETMIFFFFFFAFIRCNYTYIFFLFFLSERKYVRVCVGFFFLCTVCHQRPTAATAAFIVIVLFHIFIVHCFGRSGYESSGRNLSKTRPHAVCYKCVRVRNIHCSDRLCIRSSVV